MRPRSGGDQAALCTELVRQGINTVGPGPQLHDRIVGRVERELIQQVLQTCDRVQIKAAARLGINRNTLHKKLAEYRLDETDGVPPPDPPDATSGHRNSNGNSNDPDQDEQEEGRRSLPARFA